MSKADVLEELIKLFEPLADEVVVEVYEATKAIVEHRAGAATAARRTTQYLAAEAFIRS